MSNNSRTIEIKEVSGNRYRLVQLDDEFVIYKYSKTQGKDATASDALLMMNVVMVFLQYCLQK